MTNPGDLIDFDIIETHKENIQALPSGRSAKSLARIFSPVASASQTQDINDTARAEFESEVATADESDDPLDIFDRYVKWTLDTYPSAQSTPSSQLLPLLERATKAFIKNDQYKNDPRYLKLWLHYIRFFSDAPRETFAYLSRHGVGEKLALYYEEFAAWLEANDRWAQAEEVYIMGTEKGARPAERLMRKLGEFHKRAAARIQDSNGPSSPALPVARAALAAKIDPYAAPATTDPQAQAAARSTTGTSKKAKMQIFSDDGAAPAPAVAGGAAGWDSIGNVKERKKENTVAAQPWAGQTLGVGSRSNVGMPKMPIYQDQSLLRQKLRRFAEGQPIHKKIIPNQRDGKLECVFVNLEAVYPNENDQTEEYCFEELRAANRGWLDRDWAAERARNVKQQVDARSKEIVQARPPLTDIEPHANVPAEPSPAEQAANDLAESIEQSLLINDENAPLLSSQEPKVQKMQIFADENAPRFPSQEPKVQKMQIFADENAPPTTSKKPKAQKMQIFADENEEVAPKVVPSKPKTIRLNDENAQSSAPVDREAEIARRLRREERANKTRKIKVREVKRDDQTIQTKLHSPQGPKLRKKKIAEPTMTMVSKIATDEIYEIFNAPLKSEEPPADDASASGSESSEEEDDDDDDDDYTSGGESTCTGRISGATSEYGDETQGDLEVAKAEEEESTQDPSDNTAWSEFTISKPGISGGSAEGSESGSDDESEEAEEADNDASQIEDNAEDEDVATPVANPAPHHIPIPPNDFDIPTRPYRDAAQKAYSRLPFMTPIVEKTESSIATTASRGGKDYFTAKTPCPKTSHKTPTIPEDDELWSSPFEEALGVVKDIEKIPAPPLLTKAKLKPISKPATTNTVASAKKGPIILDAQCNPMEASIHNTILQQIHPPLSSFEGYFDRTSESCGAKPKIKKFCSSVANTKGGGRNGGDKTSSTLAIPPILRFEGAEQAYAVKRELGAGAYAPVYLVEHVGLAEEETDENEPAVARMGKGQFGVARRPLEALKIEEPASAWEFYILRTVHRRLGLTRAAHSIIKAYELHIFAEDSYLVEEYLESGTLLSLVNTTMAANTTSGGSGAALDEALAMFFMVELLRTVEALHAKGIIHGDLKADNIMLRLGAPTSSSTSTTSTSDSSSTADLSPTYAPTGTGAWTTIGISLIDFGRGIDMRAFTPSVTFIADWETCASDCAEMRELRPWTYQADYHGLAAIAHTLLFGRYIDTVVEKGSGNALGGGGGGKRYRLKEGLKRYWQGEVWGMFFEMMLNSGAEAAKEGAGEAGKLPLLGGMRRCRERMEEWLVANCERGVGLKGMLRRVEGLVGERRRK